MAQSNQSNGPKAYLFGLVEGKRHDCGMLGDLGMLCKLHLYEHGLNRYKPRIYGDSSYPLKQLLMVQFTGAAITLLQDVWNKSMSQLRISVERVFGDIIN